MKYLRLVDFPEQYHAEIAMFRALKSLSVKRWPWLLLALTALLLLATGLYFQYSLNYQPCIKCIYVRAAFAGVLLAAILVACAPRQSLLRIMGILAWLAAAIYGTLQAQELVNIEQILASGGFTTCALFADFPAWLALDKWFSAVFAVTGTCGGVDWQFVGFTMAEWSRFILAAYALVGLLVLFSQFTKPNKNPYM
ncbi:disulfide bond formation protein DsbB [Alishewanella longhuensis]|uniref:disulfide bond formation protein DsbB n=1 Tax=Alishewanella longhuensis TaxID=1091037 RepID=UPI001E3048EE|nr:disulfide bond formation protein DsbB [Alishewanella longhuensis]